MQAREPLVQPAEVLRVTRLVHPVRGCLLDVLLQQPHRVIQLRLGFDPGQIRGTSSKIITIRPQRVLRIPFNPLLPLGPVDERIRV